MYELILLLLLNIAIQNQNIIGDNATYFNIL